MVQPRHKTLHTVEKGKYVSRYDEEDIIPARAVSHDNFKDRMRVAERIPVLP
jgi:hypothetical protein